MKTKSINEFPKIENPEGATFIGYKDIEGTKTTVQVDFEDMTPLFDVTQDITEGDITNAVSSDAVYSKVLGGSSKNLQEIDNEANKYLLKGTEFFTTGYYRSDNTFNPSANWRTQKIEGVSGDLLKYHIYSIGATPGNLGANIITFKNASGTIISSIPATGDVLRLFTGTASFPDGATEAHISTQSQLHLADSYYEIQRTIEEIDKDAKLTTVTYTDFVRVGFYQDNNTFNPSANWRTSDITGESGNKVDYNIWSIGGANIVTFKNASGTIISSIPAGGSTAALRQIKGSFVFPDNAVTASLCTHNTHISDSYYQRTTEISKSFEAVNKRISDIENKTYKTYVVKGSIPTSSSSFQTIAEALAVAVSGDLILVFSGTYNEVSLNVPNDVTIRGVGYVYINGYLPVTSTTANVENISTIDMVNGGTLENLIVTAKNMRYPIHADFSVGKTTKNVLNCRFIHYGNQEIYNWRVDNAESLPIGQKAANLFRACSAWGGGTKAGDRVYITGCYFESPMRSFSTHNNTDFNTTYGASIVKLTDCEFVSHGIDRDGSNIGFNASIVIQSLASNSSDRVIFNNCRANGFACFHNALTHEVYMNIKGLRTVYNTLGSASSMTDQIGIIDVSKYQKVPDEVTGFKNLGAQNISRGKAVKRNSYGVELMTSADDASLFFGVAMQDIEVNKSGDVKKEGYLIRPYMDGLASVVLTDGDSISVTASGSFEKSATTVVCKAVDNQNVKIA